MFFVIKFSSLKRYECPVLFTLCLISDSLYGINEWNSQKPRLVISRKSSYSGLDILLFVLINLLWSNAQRESTLNEDERTSRKKRGGTLRPVFWPRTNFICKFKCPKRLFNLSRSQVTLKNVKSFPGGVLQIKLEGFAPPPSDNLRSVPWNIAAAMQTRVPSRRFAPGGPSWQAAALSDRQLPTPEPLLSTQLPQAEGFQRNFTSRITMCLKSG